jgi:hypothetical protein
LQSTRNVSTFALGEMAVSIHIVLLALVGESSSMDAVHLASTDQFNKSHFALECAFPRVWCDFPAISA